MFTPRRSTTGCTWCKIRRKKCDENKPQCRRCLTTGKACRYEYVEYSGSESHRVKRTKPAPRDNSERRVKDTRNGSVMPVPPNTGLVIPQLGNAVVSLPHLHPNTVQSNASFDSMDMLRLPTSVRSVSHMIPSTSSSTSEVFGEYNSFENLEDRNGAEGVRAFLCRVPNVDKNVKENTLPFVLYCYSQWAIATVLEPGKVIRTLRDQVAARFSSDSKRVRSILIANVMNMFVKDFVVDGASKSILDHLTLEIQNTSSDFMASSPSFVPAVDRQKAIRIMDNMFEIITLQLDTHPTSYCVQIFERIAPVFRRACPDLPGRPINLPNLLMDFSFNLRHFAAMDIIMSLLTGLSPRFKYEVPFSLELCDRVYRWQLEGNYGLQPLYGIPDQYLMLLAWINTLSETPGASANTGLITWIETNLPRIKVAIDDSEDPSLRIGRMAVLESWRFTVLIYLYLVLCKADAHDPRVMRARNGFVRFIKGVTPGRIPDTYLIIPLTMAGMVAIDARDRNTLRRRILGVGEYAEEGTAGNDITLMLEDIWARTRDQGRAAVWSDMRRAYYRLPRR